jgi:hypothetical protein
LREGRRKKVCAAAILGRRDKNLSRFLHRKLRWHSAKIAVKQGLLNILSFFIWFLSEEAS